MNRPCYCELTEVSDNSRAPTMSIFRTCCNTFASLSRAAAKKAGSHMRQLGLLVTQYDWRTRAEVCSRCPMCVTRGTTSYCGLPYVEKPMRDFVREGCGCPIIAKAKSPNDHCPLTWQMEPATKTDSKCTCKWCNPK